MFKYPDTVLPTTPFVAEISEQSGSFSGSTLEPDVHNSGPIKAILAGFRSGQAVDFTKTYFGQSEGYRNPVDYVGQVSADGQTITGIWSLLDWNGEFEMTREAGLELVQEERASVEL